MLHPPGQGTRCTQILIYASGNTVYLIGWRQINVLNKHVYLPPGDKIPIPDVHSMIMAQVTANRWTKKEKYCKLLVGMSGRA